MTAVSNARSCGRLVGAFVLALASLHFSVPAFALTATTTTLTSSVNPATIGQSTTLKATVNKSAATGTVTFKDGTTTLGTGTLSSGVATLSKTFTTTGTHSLTAVYAGNSTYATSTSAAVSETVNKASSTTVLASSVNPAVVGQASILKATITPTAATGTVTFKDGTTTLGTGTISSGVATLSKSFATTGAHSLTAVYAGDTSYATSTSAALAETVNATSTTTALASSVNPAVIAQNTTLTATIVPSAATGTVTFKDGTTTLGTGTVSSGVATLSTSFATTGTHSLTAFYAGDTSYATSTSTALSQAINVAASTTTLTSSVNPAAVGQSTALTATVAPSTATGTVTFKDGATTLGTGTLSSGIAALSQSFSTTGAHSVTAVYAGDTSYSGSTSAVLGQTISTATTSTTLVVSPNPAQVGQAATFTATVTGASPTGTVTFSDSSVVQGTAAVTAGVATLVKTFSAPYTDVVKAQYSGDSSNATSVSTVVFGVVQPLATTTTLTASVNPAHVGELVDLVAAVDPWRASGNITFKDGAATIGVVAVANGVAKLTTSFATIAAHSLTAAYAPDSVNNLASASAALVENVNNAPVALPSPPTSPVPITQRARDAQENLYYERQFPDSNTVISSSATFDTLNRRKSATDANSGVTAFSYDGQDATIAVTDPRNLGTQYVRNGLGAVTRLVSPDTGTANQTYDSAGNLATRTDSRGVLATTSYDAVNRQTSIAYTQSGQTTLTYGWTYDQTGTGFSNGVGRLTSTSHPSGSSQYSYDPQGRLLTETQRVAAATGGNAAQVTATVIYSYDAGGNVTSITYPSGRMVTFAYAAGKPTTVSLAKDTASTPTLLINQIQFSPFGGVLGWQWQMTSGAQANNRVYDTSGRLVRYQLGSYTRDLTFDGADRITTYTHYDTSAGPTAQSNALNQSFAYDGLGHITSVTTATASWSIGYDANGNRTSVTLNGAPSNYATEATSNRLTSVDNPARSLSYDSAGNTTADTAGYTSTYNLAGRLGTLTKAGLTSTFAYDGTGRRVRKFASSGAASTVIFVYDQGSKLLGEYDQNGSVLREYVWLGDTPVALFTSDPTNSANPPVVYYVHADHLDTPRVVVDQANNVRWRWMSEPFGTAAPEANPSSLGQFAFNLRFPGQYADVETGLNYNYFRDYDSSIGRYVQSDPIGLQGGINTYAYVGGNPLSYTDPLGLAPRKLDPGSQECRQLQDKIKRRSDFIAKYARDIYNDTQNLPINPSIPGLPDKFSQLGHAERMEREIGFQRRDIDLYNEKCGCPDDDCKNGGAGATQNTPQSTPSSSSSSSSTTSKIAIGGGILVCAAACIAFPEICIPGLLLGGLATK